MHISHKREAIKLFITLVGEAIKYEYIDKHFGNIIKHVLKETANIQRIKL